MAYCRDDAWVESCYLSAQADAEILVHGDPVVALGRGYAYATAREAALKLIECGRIPCQAFSSADFEHGPKALVTGDAVAVAFSGERIAEGTTLFPPPTPSEIPEELIPIWHSIYAQWLAYWAARYRRSRPGFAATPRKSNEDVLSRNRYEFLYVSIVKWSTET